MSTLLRGRAPAHRFLEWTLASSLALLTAVGGAAHAAKPTPPLELRLTAPERVEASALAVRVEVELLAAASILELTIEGGGAATLTPFSERAVGPWSPGDIYEMELVVPSSLGEGVFSIRASALGGSGEELFARRAEGYVLAEPGVLWSSTSSPTDLRLRRLERRLRARSLSPEDADAELAAILTAPAVSDDTPRPQRPLSPHERRVQDVFHGAYDRQRSLVERGSASITVNGRVLWTDRNGGTHGLPMAVVEIRDEDLLGSELVTTVMTDAAGNYSASFMHDDGVLQGDPDIFVRVLARSPVADVRPDAAGAATYRMESGVTDEVATGSTLTRNLTVGNVEDSETAFSVHHAMVMIGAYAGNLAGSTPSQIVTRFPTTRHTSLFNGSELHILRADRWDWDVCHHEYGHYFTSVHGIEDNPGGDHSTSENLASRIGKDAGTRLAWGEGFPTFFGISGQQVMGASSLNVPDVGDRRYQDTEDASIDHDLETKNGLGEDNEASVFTALWDTFDGAADGLDQFQTSDRAIFMALKGATAKTAGAAWEALAAPQTTAGKTRLGGAWGETANIAPELVDPPDNFEIVGSAAAPTFRWVRNGGGAPNPLNDFRIRFYKSDFSAIVFEKELGDTTTFTPTPAELASILGMGTPVKWVVEGKNTSAPTTPGGALDRYWSAARTLGSVDIALVIDDTGSMGEEIDAVKNALQRFIDEIESRLGPEGEPPTIQVLTFKDNVTERIVSNDLDAVRSVIAGLFASGGGDCPEFSAQGLVAAASTVSPGGTILLATDASSRPGVDIGALIASLRARSVSVNTILSGDCTGIESRATRGRAAGQIFDSSQVRQAAGKPDSGEEEPSQGPIADPGQDPVDAHGGTPETATRMLPDGSPVRGLVGVDPSDLDFFVFALEAGETYTVVVQQEDGSGGKFELLESDGTTVLQTRTLFTTAPSVFLLEPAVSGDYFLRVSKSSAGQVPYLALVSNDPFAALVTAVDMFSTISGQTGGAFFIRDDVNFSSSAPYEAALFNTLLSTLGPAVLLANPDGLPRGATLSVNLIGRNTNWRPGSSVAFSGGGLAATSVVVSSATSLSALVGVDPGAGLGFRDVTVTTPLGAGSEAAFGSDLLAVTPVVTTPTLLSVEPGTVNRGDSLTVLIRGLNTAWDATSVPALGAEIDVVSSDTLSPGLLEAQVSVQAGALIGFRTATVTTGGASESKQRALFVSSGIASLPEILSVTPGEGFAGQSLNVIVEGNNTSFEAGLTAASFGAGIEVLGVDVIDADSAAASIRIDAAAAPGFRTVSFVTGGEQAVLLDGFFVDERPAGLYEIPTLSRWGLATLALLVAALALLALRWSAGGVGGR